MDEACGCGRARRAPKRRICRLCINEYEAGARLRRADGTRGRPCVVQGCDRTRLETPSQVLPYCHEHRLAKAREGDNRRRREAGKPQRILKQPPPGIPDGSRWCSKCELVKSEGDFHKDGRTPGGRQRACASCQYEAYQQRLAADPVRVRKIASESQLRNRKRRQYGLTNEQIAEMAEAQGGLCASCGQRPPPARASTGGLCVDHHHGTGWNRGLICHPCNRGIGFLGDTTEAVERASRYLRRADAAYEEHLAATALSG